MRFSNYQKKLSTTPLTTIRIKYPKDWEINEKELNSIVVFLAPIENGFDHFRENVSIIEIPISSSFFLFEEYVNSSIFQLKQSILNFQLIKKKKTKISKKKVIKIVFSGKKRGINIKILQCYFLTIDHLFLLTYTAQNSEYDEYRKAIKKMIKSFEIS
ncbi:MAG: DUF1795 domain-containing protein [Candidatus Lokiarchaeota archaeon]|nr:DUF1795 domain-containing protein [Candidatus Lokiarchaeota archaeon]MBD3341130.1 DUF1795 domain-containing protein [Candidatus Lokiarchaeota archaeon]